MYNYISHIAWIVTGVLHRHLLLPYGVMTSAAGPVICSIYKWIHATEYWRFWPITHTLVNLRQSYLYLHVYLSFKQNSTLKGIVIKLYARKMLLKSGACAKKGPSVCVFSVRFRIRMAQHRILIETLQRAKQKGGRNYTFRRILTTNRGRNTTFS